jgi:RimJ/RimL family protein N-acetyltransferase
MIIEEMKHRDYTIRRFLPGDAALYRAIRLEALQYEPAMFLSSYAMEADYPQAHWESRMTNPDSAFWGLYAGDELIGLTGIVIDKENRDTGYMGQSYIRIAHRGKGLSRMLYDARIEWARAHGLKRLTIGHRESNTVSKAANQHFGFTYTHRETRNWPDGVMEDIVYYELVL